MDYFVEAYIDHTTRGIIAALEGAAQFDDIEEAEVSVKGSEAFITVNGKQVPLNSFVSALIRNTLLGMVSSLKGVEEIKAMKIAIKKV
jgi:copper chaperone CopZ